MAKMLANHDAKNELIEAKKRAIEEWEAARKRKKRRPYNPDDD